MRDDLNEDEQLRLLFRAGGLDVVTDAKDSFHSLTEEMQGTAKAADKVQDATKTVDTTTEEAKRVLSETSTVVSDLQTKIASLEKKQNDLAESFRFGLIPSASDFKEQYDHLGGEISRNQSILEAATGTGDGESGKGGFAGLAGGAIKAEKAISALATGHGLGRLGGLLEPLVGLIGGPAGLGLAIGAMALAIEGLLPKLGTWIEKMDGAAEAAKRAAKAEKEYQEVTKKGQEKPSEAESDQAEIVKLMFKGKGQQLTQQGIEQALREGGFGLTDEDKQLLKLHWLQEDVREDIEKRQRQAIQKQTVELMKGLERGAGYAVSEVSQMAGRRPDQFPVNFREALEASTPEAITEAKAQDKAEDEAEAERIGRKQARFAEAKKKNAREKEHAKNEAEDEAEADRAQNKIDHQRAQDAAKAERDRRQAETKAERDRRHAETEAERDHRQAEAQAARQAREATPEAINRRAAAAQQNEEMGEAQRQNQLRAQYGGNVHPAFDPSDLQQVVASVGRNRVQNSSLGFTLAQQVDYYMGQLEAKMVSDFVRSTSGLRGSQRSGQNNTGFP